MTPEAATPFDYSALAALDAALARMSEGELTEMLGALEEAEE